MNFFNGFGFGKPHDKGCGCNDGGNDIIQLLMLVWLLTSCGCNINFDICELLPILMLLSLLSTCFGGCGNTCGKPY